MRSIFNRIFLSWTWFDQIIIGTVKAFSRNTYNKHENNLYMVYLRSNYVFQMNIFVTMRKLCCSFQHQQEIKSIKIRALDKHLMKNFINVFHHGYLQMESFILKIDTWYAVGLFLHPFNLCKLLILTFWNLHKS